MMAPMNSWGHMTKRGALLRCAVQAPRLDHPLDLKSRGTLVLGAESDASRRLLPKCRQSGSLWAAAYFPRGAGRG